MNGVLPVVYAIMTAIARRERIVRPEHLDAGHSMWEVAKILKYVLPAAAPWMLCGKMRIFKEQIGIILGVILTASDVYLYVIQSGRVEINSVL